MNDPTSNSNLSLSHYPGIYGPEYQKMAINSPSFSKGAATLTGSGMALSEKSRG